MVRLTRLQFWRLAIGFVAAGAAILAPTATMQAQDGSLEVEKVTPYTGPPILLDEPEPKPPATLVDTEMLTEKYEDGTVRVEREIARYSDDRRAADGVYREYYPNGKPFTEGTYRDGAQHGEWTYWHDNGTKNRTTTYKNGKPDGSWEVFRADGTLEATRGYKDGKRDGTWLYYYDTGKQQKGEEHYTDGKADGIWKTWWENGQLQKQVGFKMGQQHGDALQWSEEGDKRVEASYDEGKPHGTATVWTADGRKFVQEYDHGKLLSRTQEE
jgi:antitoxin component YwqK of YwqJK toxin-antitoxin module